MSEKISNFALVLLYSFMKQKRFLSTLLMLAALMTACTEKLDLKNIDPHAQAKMALALPVGEMSVTVGDLLGNTGIYYREDGALYWQDTVKMQRQFHPININKYCTSVTHDLLLSTIPGFEGQSIIVGDNSTHTLSFPLQIKFDNINDVFSEERIDSLYIAEASFISNIQENFGLNPTYIKRVALRLPAEIHKAGSKTLPLPIDNFAFGSNIRVTIKDFVIDFMKDHKAQPSSENVTNSVTFMIDFDVCIPTGEIITIDAHSGFTYRFDVDFMDFVALWGRFAPDKEMNIKEVMDIDTVWKAWSKIRSLHLPLTEPQIDIHFISEIGVPLCMHLDHFSAKEEASGEVRYAKFDGSKSWDYTLSNFVKADAPLNATAENIITFSNKPSQGEIDQLFTIRPDQISYDCSVYINDDPYYQTQYPQHRLTKNTEMNFQIVITLPFVFNKGMDVSYSDTLKNVEINQLSLDSLVKDVKQIEKIETKELNLILTTENKLPFDIDLALLFLDENYAEIDLGSVTKGTLSKPGINHMTISLNQESLNKLTKVKHILYTAGIADVNEKALTQAATTYPVKILNTSSVKVKMAIAADVEAYLSLSFDK